ncbi:MAG: hypothetical protein FJZ97_07425 [Chloroflexi bacterium]|nr:hypothetical protein [Chloroflexota bacterium]
MSEIPALVDALIGPVVAMLLTTMVLSYLIGDNPLFRIASHLFIGVAAGYAGALAARSVLWPGLVQPILQAGLGGLIQPAAVLTLIVPALLALLLLLKVVPGASRLGTFSTAFLVGVGAAVVVGGAITGTLIPQSLAAMGTLNPAVVSPQTGETGLERVVNVIVVLVGTVSTLAYFRFTMRRKPAGSAKGAGPITLAGRALSAVGRSFIALAFGVMYAGALSGTLLILAQRIQSLWDALLGLLP